MGVAHAIGNKTIMIAQDAKELPFDISNYRCIIYKQSIEGLQKLQEQVVESLRELEKWGQQPSNPVQDFKPFDAFVPQSAVEKLRNELKEKEALLTASTSKAEREKLQQQTRRLQHELEALQKELAEKATENAKLKEDLKRLRPKTAQPKTSPPSPLRSQPLESLSEKEAQQMLKERGFFDSSQNQKGKGSSHKYEAVEQNGEQLVLDHATGLAWQQSGSPDERTYANAEKYVHSLNEKNFAGHNDWRLPTLEEAMSLMEPKKHGDLYIDPVFDKTQRWIWTADKYSAGAAWTVSFGIGSCYSIDLHSYYCVRAVC